MSNSERDDVKAQLRDELKEALRDANLAGERLDEAFEELTAFAEKSARMMRNMREQRELRDKLREKRDA